MRAILSAFLVLALTLSSFGHRSLSLTQAAQAEAFILAGGDWAEICGEGGDPLAATAKCKACVIAQTCIIASHGVAAMPDPTGHAVNWSRPADANTWATSYGTHPARAPPFV